MYFILEMLCIRQLKGLPRGLILDRYRGDQDEQHAAVGGAGVFPRLQPELCHMCQPSSQQEAYRAPNSIPMM